MRVPVAPHPCCILIARHDAGERNCCQEAFSDVVVRCGGGEVFYSPMIRSQSFSEPVPLDWELQKCFSFPAPSPLRWDRMARTGWR